jgi:UDP-4-amino-4,6-dideoxy-N-acetyl-beta-L-altrosamine transaminase
MIPYGRQYIDQLDIDTVNEVLRSEFLTQGPTVPKFEEDVTRFVGAKHGVAVNSATSALHIACMALGVGPGDYVWTTPNTFVASANCALYCQANVDFVDINDRTYNLDVELLENKLKSSAKMGTLPKAIIPVHFAGQSCDMEAIHKLSRIYQFAIIEDASHAIGATYQGKPVGSCQFSEITVFSFHPVKIITSGEGGMITTNNTKIHQQLIRLRSHGITRDPNIMTTMPDGPWYYEQLELGYNYRMTDIQAALGCSQMNKLTRFLDRRRQIALRYNDLLSSLPLSLPYQNPEAHSSWHLYVVQLHPTHSADFHKNVFEFLRKAGIAVNLHYIPVHLHPYYKSLGFQKGDFPRSERYYQHAISLPIYYGMTDNDQDYVVDMLQKALDYNY